MRRDALEPLAQPYDDDGSGDAEDLEGNGDEWPATGTGTALGPGTLEKPPPLPKGQEVFSEETVEEAKQFLAMSVRERTNSISVPIHIHSIPSFMFAICLLLSRLSIHPFAYPCICFPALPWFLHITATYFVSFRIPFRPFTFHMRSNLPYPVQFFTGKAKIGSRFHSPPPKLFVLLLVWHSIPGRRRYASQLSRQ